MTPSLMPFSSKSPADDQWVGTDPRTSPFASAWERALATGRRLIAAMATAALSMMRLITISATSVSMGTGSAATSAIFQANCADLEGVSADG